ncbi:MAG: crossover junction endodeoxyribonuclease RuvC [Microscillaceae bacterium]|nr:crossover junction endodeoxyribonuclease RuvC [Microscillaceae bacterium]MDW8460782.1 crossover junction endodeoxyribonuclease RuvC [Cytophagales bacterium]
MNQNNKEKIILGIDPGTRILGYGIILCKGTNEIGLLQYGVIHLAQYKSQALRLKKIFERITQLIEEFDPDEMALEAPFYSQNVQVALKLGRAQGVAMAAALVREIPITEYAPRKVKQSVTGNGDASKEQVAGMLKKLLNLNIGENDLLDATDALGVAVCHHFQKGLKVTTKKTWADFVQENPKRIRE